MKFFDTVVSVDEEVFKRATYSDLVVWSETSKRFFSARPTNSWTLAAVS